jgi:hypothetical protein
MKTENLIVEKAIAPFKNAIGDTAFPKVCNDIRSMLGRVEKDIVLKDGDWKAGASFKLSRKNGETIPLPPNNPATILLCFGMRFNELAKSADCEIEAGIPAQCKAWVTEHSRKTVESVAVTSKA